MPARPRNDAPARWLVAEIATGLQRLVLLRLEGAPAADAIEGAALAWADALLARAAWVEARDAPRLREAFRQLAAHAVRWPAPAQLWEHLPPRPEVRELPPPPPTEEERQRVRAMLADLARRLRAGRP